MDSLSRRSSCCNDAWRELPRSRSSFRWGSPCFASTGQSKASWADRSLRESKSDDEEVRNTGRSNPGAIVDLGGSVSVSWLCNCIWSGTFGTMALSQKESDIQLMLAASCHLGTKNCDYQMERYVYRRRLDGIYVINLGKTWEKLQLAARIIVAIENPQDIVVQSARPYGQRAVLKFAQYTGAKALAGRHTPGTTDGLAWTLTCKQASQKEFCNCCSWLHLLSMPSRNLH